MIAVEVCFHPLCSILMACGLSSRHRGRRCRRRRRRFNSSHRTRLDLQIARCCDPSDDADLATRE